jgi:hypothetical protein
MTHTRHDAAVVVIARRSPPADEVSAAPAIVIGTDAGNVARHCPALVATPLPPRKPFQKG